MKKALLFILLFLLCACSGQKGVVVPSQTETIVPFYHTQPLDIEIIPKLKPVRVGMLLPLSGKYRQLGEDLVNAAVLAQFEVAKNFTISPYDTQGTAEGAQAAFMKAKQDSVDVILGPVFAAEVAKVAPLARRSDIPVFSFSSDKDNLGDGVYSLALTLENQTERIIRFACEKGAQKLSILAPDNKAGDIAIDAAKKTAEACGMDIVHLSVYNPTFVNFDPYVVSVLPESFAEERKNKQEMKKKLRSGALKQKDIKEDVAEENTLTIAEQLDFDALFIADDGNRLKSISALFGMYDVSPDDVLFLGLSTWNDRSLSKEGSLKHAYYPVLPVGGHTSFIKKYKETYAKEPSSKLASLSYDGVSLLWVLTSKPDWKYSDLLHRAEFVGTDGSFRFNENGTVERLMGVYQIKGTDRFSRIERASRNFAEEDAQKAKMYEIRMYNSEEE
ncbi:MAG: penicillin-binding protein activator [Alphaproteobacteria bacterium]